MEPEELFNEKSVLNIFDTSLDEIANVYDDFNINILLERALITPQNLNYHILKRICVIKFVVKALIKSEPENKDFSAINAKLENISNASSNLIKQIDDLFKFLNKNFV